MDNENYGRDETCPAENGNRTEEQADAACGELPKDPADSSSSRGPAEPPGPCTHSTPGAADGAGQAEDRNAASVTGPAVMEDRNAAAATGPAVPEEISELEWMQKHVRANKKGRRREPRFFRKTELHDRPSSIISTRAAGKKQRPGHHTDEPEFPVPEEIQEFAESLIGHLNEASEDLYLQVALVDEQVSELDKMLRKTTRQFERRIAELEERGRWT